MEDVAAKLEAAWEVFARTCANAVAPEATFQAWFAHYLISQFGIDRVAREPIFNHRHADSMWQALVPGGEVKLDAVVLRQPGVNLPHYVHRPADADGDRDRTGMATLADLAVISELKVAATAGKGLHHRQVAQDVYKLSMLLEQAEPATYSLRWLTSGSSTTTSVTATTERAWTIASQRSRITRMSGSLSPRSQKRTALRHRAHTVEDRRPYGALGYTSDYAPWRQTPPDQAKR